MTGTRGLSRSQSLERDRHRVSRLRVGVSLGLALSVMPLAAGCGGHNESWEYGYRHADDAAKMAHIGWGEGSSCRGVAGFATEDGGDLVYSEIVEGCLAGLKDRNS